MYIIGKGTCTVCGDVTVPHTDSIPGTSLGPILRGIIHVYRLGNSTEDEIRMFLLDIHKVKFSEGTISSCISAITDDLDRKVTTVPDEEPVTVQEDLRTYRSPVPPADSSDTIYGRIEAALTQHSSMWTSSLAPPIMTSIQEKASMSPYVSTDETSNKVGGGMVQTTVATGNRTVQIRIIKNRDAKTLRNTWESVKNRPAMRDGTKGYEWMQGMVARCWVHLLRATEEVAMKHALGSPQYVRHRMLLDIYRDAVQVADEVVKRAGGPVTCASQLNLIDKVPGLAKYVKRQIRSLTKRVNKAISICPPDSVTTTLSNAIPNMFCALMVPGMPLHNNYTERIIRDMIVKMRRRVTFPCMKGANNFAIMRTFAATCWKNGISVYDATILMAKDPTWNIFNHAIPPPIFGTRGDVVNNDDGLRNRGA